MGPPRRRLARPLLIIAMAGGVAVQAACYAEDLPPILESQPLSTSPSGGGRSLTLEARVARLENLLEDQTLLEMLTRLEELQKEVQELRGSVEVQGHDLEGIKQRQRDLYLDIDRRLRQAETASGKTAPPPLPATEFPAPGSTGIPPAQSPAVLPEQAQIRPGDGMVAPVTGEDGDSLAEQSAYQHAFNLLKEGRYDEAIGEFSVFLSRYPGGQFSGNAQYWLGEANYVTRRFPSAVEEFKKVLMSYPDSGKAPDAMLKLGFSYYELSEWEQTRNTLNELVQRFPRSTAAQLAQNRLHRMKLEGR